MGLLTILSRRPGKYQSREDTLRSQQVVPLQSSRPVSMNISGTRTTTAGHPETRLSEGSPNQAIENNATKASLNPAFRGLFENDRPGSADSSHSANSDRPRVLQRPRREARRPPLSFRKPSSLSSMHTTLADQPTSQFRGTNIEALLSSEDRERTGSMTSLARRQSKDLLDAVEEFRPLDFRSRVLAAGARDYGEDVADRNIRISTTISSPNLYSQFSSGRSISAQSMRVNSRTKSISSISEHYNPTTREPSSQAELDRPEFFTRRNKNRLSLNTYRPSGFVSPSLPTPRSSVTTPGYRGGMTPSDFDSPDVELDLWSRQYHMSPTVSNFSLPRSPPRVTRQPIEVNDSQPGCIDEENNFSEEREFGDFIPSNRSSQRKSAASDAQVSTRAAARFSQGTYRSSLASSVTSRFPSMDFMPLGYPRLQGQPKIDLDSPSNSDEPSTRFRSQSLRSHRHTRSNSSGHAGSQQRTRSLLTVPTGLENLVEADGQTVEPRSSSTRDWTLITPSNGSTSSSSNGPYSGASGSMRPVSRHTKATSIDSIPRPPSSQSCLSASVGQSAGGWSPSTTRSTGFNIDDYVSSDDDSFTTKKRRPSGEGEEELLFKDGYGVTGASLPGLLESMVGASPPRARSYRASQLRSPPEQPEEEGEAEDNDDAAEGPDIDDVRCNEIRHQPRTLSRLMQRSLEHEQFRTFGRQSGRPLARSSSIPSWVPSDDWAHTAQTKRPAAAPSSRPSSRLSSRPSSRPSSSSNAGMYEDLRPPCRGQKRLSALGTLHGRNVDSTDGEGAGVAKKANSSKVEPVSPIKEDIDPAVTLRLRKETKARKREEEAQTIREKRMTRAFGRLEEDILAALQAQGEGECEEKGEMEEDRGRTRVRGPAKEKSVFYG